MYAVFIQNMYILLSVFIHVVVAYIPPLKRVGFTPNLIKGYARARVTHIDIEDPALGKAILPRHSDYPEVDWENGKVTIQFKGHILYLTSVILGKIVKLKGNLYVGGKGKGIFLGFHKEQLVELEKYGCKLGICPKKLER
ncbi:transferase [Candidatus Mancarchaeum acidiphilum]|uniref:transferase n=1 Tax=Candidatus Mancarchaeum acidiphilum TaxID=1920749 RepID=UPI000F52BABC|nr:transferase [Candidatus Mancarchaeum acidiphilum]